MAGNLWAVVLCHASDVPSGPNSSQRASDVRRGPYRRINERSEANASQMQLWFTEHAAGAKGGKRLD